jgi:hypothetical protein
LLIWVKANGAIPADAVAPPEYTAYPHYVCRTPHAGGIHLGKTYDVHCNIGYEKVGIPSDPWAFEVLTNPQHNAISWARPAGRMRWPEELRRIKLRNMCVTHGKMASQIPERSSPAIAITNLPIKKRSNHMIISY